jgi:hypothetical protein
MMARLASANKIIMAAIQRIGHLAKSRRQLIGQLLRGFLLGARGLHHFLPVVIGSGRKINRLAAQTVVARNRIRGHNLIGMANVGNAIWVRNCGRYEKILI